MNEQNPNVTSPLATGGAGLHFEHQVAALYLALLMTNGMPPVLTQNRVEELHLQTEHLGWKTDDILVGTTHATRGRQWCAIQAKRSFILSPNNEECVTTLRRFWQDYNAAGRFEIGKDILALATLNAPGTLLKLNTLLDTARASRDATDFQHRLNTPGFINQKAKDYGGYIRQIIEQHDGTVTNETYWRFLCSLYLLNYDLGTGTSQNEAWIRALLFQLADDAHPAETASIWPILLEQVARESGVAKSFTADTLPSELASWMKRPSRVSVEPLLGHSRLTMANIRNSIGTSTTLSRPAPVAQVFAALESYRAVLITGPAGGGKSSVAKTVFDTLGEHEAAFAFRAEELSHPHLDNALALAQAGLTVGQLRTALAAQSRKIVFIESMERLLETSTRDACADLLRLVADDPSWRIVVTCRSYSSELVRNAFFADHNLSVVTIEVPPLNDDELEQIKTDLPYLRPLIDNPRLGAVTKIPYVLDLASRTSWAEAGMPESATERELRKILWGQAVRSETLTRPSLSRTRENTMIALALRRAKALTPYVTTDDLDAPSIDYLRDQDLVTVHPQHPGLSAPAHDVLEDWAILEWLEQHFLESGQNAAQIEACIEGYPAIRRGFRRWLEELLTHDQSAAERLFQASLDDFGLNGWFRDDIASAVLLSEHGPELLSRVETRLLDNNGQRLQRVIHLLRVACKGPSPRFATGLLLPTSLLIPKGASWTTVLNLARLGLDRLMPESAGLLVGLIEDWSMQCVIWEPELDGADDVAAIAIAIANHAHANYDKQIVEKAYGVLTKLPVAAGEHLIELMTKADRDRREHGQAHDFADYLLNESNATYICKAHPDAIIDLALRMLCLSRDDIQDERRYGGGFNTDVEPMFGIPEHLNFDSFPPSALRGPFMSLLRYHPNKGVALITKLINHAANWYHHQTWPSFNLEPTYEISLTIEGDEPLTQFANERFWGMYRGLSVAPYVLQSGLMALEVWLFELAENDAVTTLDDWLLHCLSQSNNVGITAVIASVCTAHPIQAPRSALCLLGCRDLFLMDLHRHSRESSTSMLFGTMPSPTMMGRVYNNERAKSSAMKHRRKHLEMLAVDLQLTEHRPAVCEVIDAHKLRLPPIDDQDDEDKQWRLVLHRMDTRNFTAVTGDDVPAEYRNTAPSDSAVLLLPGQPAEDLQQVIDEGAEERDQINTDLGHLNWAISLWEYREPSLDHDWHKVLSDLMERDFRTSPLDEITRGLPSRIASLCLRDYAEGLTEPQDLWCRECVHLTVGAGNHFADQIARVQLNIMDGDRAAAFVCAKLVSKARGDGLERPEQIVLACALTHATSEVRHQATLGVANFLSKTNATFTHHLVTSLTRLGLRLNEEIATEQNKLYVDRMTVAEIESKLIPETRKFLSNLPLEITVPTKEGVANLLGGWHGRRYFLQCLIMLEPMGNDPLAMIYHSVAAAWLVSGKDDGESESLRRDYQFQHELSHRLSQYVIRLTPDEASTMIHPITMASRDSDKEVAQFTKDLLYAADSSETPGPLWGLWQAIADRTVTEASQPSTPQKSIRFNHELIRVIFLGLEWKPDVKNWRHLNGEHSRINQLFIALPASPQVFEMYLEYLFTVGRQTLPDPFRIIGEKLHSGSTSQTPLNSNSIYILETLLRPYIFATPERIKADPAFREPLLNILDVMVECGSSAAFHMRDDYTTP